jgi:FkbM family methyltransferase
MYVDLRSAIGRGIFMQGEFDPAVFQPFAMGLKPGDTFVDLGANVGYYSLLALDVVNKTGSIYAFEIDDRPLRCLRKTIITQQISNIHLIEKAVGDSIGTSCAVKMGECGNTHLTDHSANGTPVATITLDHWYLNCGKPRVHAIKMDIEGSELRALQGAKLLISEQRPLIVCEAWDNAADPLQGQVARLLRELNYKVTALEGAHSPAIMASQEGDTG